jgi:hypothetical protein
VITQSLGDTSQHLKPDYKRYDLERNDRFLLCSDGLNTMLTDAQIGQILLEEPDEMLCAKALVDAANAAGGHDNITVIVCDVVGVEVVASSLPYQEMPTVKVVSAPAKSSFWANKRILMGFGVAALGILGFWGWKSSNPKKEMEVVATAEMPKLMPKPVELPQNVGGNNAPIPKLTVPKQNIPMQAPPKSANPPVSVSEPPTNQEPNAPISIESLDEILEKFFEKSTLTRDQKNVQMDFRAKNKNACECLEVLKDTDPEAKKLYDKRCNKAGSMIDVHRKSTDLYISLAATKNASSLKSEINELKKK